MTGLAVVAGAGPAGLSAAIQLASWCEEVLLVDASPDPASTQIGEHLPPAGIVELTVAGYESLVNKDGHKRSSGVQAAWGSEEPIDKDYFLTIPGYGVNLDRLQLHDQLTGRAASAGVSIALNTRISAVDSNEDCFTLELTDRNSSRQLKPQILVDATGRRAAIARKLGAARMRTDHLIGLSGTARIRTPLDDGGRLYIETMEDGWWYAVSLDEFSMTCTFMTDSIIVHESPLEHDALWCARLEASNLISRLVETDQACGTVSVHDASTQLVSAPVIAGFATTGDAAMALDPLFSWGVTKGICDGHGTATSLQRDAESPGRHPCYSRYQAARNQAFNYYLKKQHDFYLSEIRWPHAPFWQSRQQHCLTQNPVGDLL